MEDDLDRQDELLVVVLGQDLAAASMRLLGLLLIITALGAAAAYLGMRAA
jgi:hypothetical protein